MKISKTIALSLVAVSFFSNVSFGGGMFSASERRSKPILTEVNWVGSFRCDEKIHESNHPKNHECDLEFVNDETGDAWTVKSTPELLSIHQKENGPVRAKVEALRTPRYLLGGGYVKVIKIELLKDTKSQVGS